MKKLSIVMMLTLASLIPTGCNKDRGVTTSPQNPNSVVMEKGKFTSHFNSDVAVAWMDLQVKILRTTAGIPNVFTIRPYAYFGIALYQSVLPGMPAFKSLVGQLTDLPAMPTIDGSLKYYWPSSANAAMAFMTKKMFPTASVANMYSVDSLESALSTQYSSTQDTGIINRSVAFGRAVAQTVFDWSEADGYLHAFDAYTPPVGPGLWVPTPPLYSPAAAPYWGNARVMVSGSGNNAQPGAPTAYSEDPGSDFYNMAKQVYDVSQTLTTEQTNQALYWRDIPGLTAGGHYINILRQVVEEQQLTLDRTAAAYAYCGLTAFDASISCWQTKYNYNLVRPVTYIQTVLGHSTWLPLLSTPAHPEYSSAHAVISEANSIALTRLFGDNYHFTDHSYDYLGYPARSFNSFRALGKDAGQSRLYAGIHYQPSIDAGLQQGKIIANNIIRKLNY